MTKTNKGTMIITSCIILLPMAIGLVLWNQLPDVLATHWGLTNEPNGFSSKPFTVLGIPLVLLALQWVCAFASRWDKKMKHQNNRIRNLALWIIPACSVLLGGVVYSYGLGYSVDVGFWCTLFMGLLFVIVGNYLPKCKQNYTVGLKFPWTLKDPENWNKTHRLGGFLWTVCGGVTMVLAFLRWYAVIIGVFAVAVLIPVIYSYILDKRK